MIWAEWWIWILIAIALGFVELLAPAVVALGFAFGATAIGLLLLFGGPVAVWMSGSFALTLLAFACLSLLAWLLVRRVFGSRHGPDKVWEDDIND